MPAPVSFLAPVPPSHTMGTGETAPLVLNTTPCLLTGESVISATTVLTDLNIGRGTVVGGLAPPQVNSPFIVQVLPGSLLVAGHVFRLVWTFTVGVNTTWQQVLTIQVPT